jgi:hypothetical protein
VAPGSRLGDASGPALGPDTASIDQRNDGTAAERMVEERLRHAPTRHAKSQIQGSADPRVGLNSGACAKNSTYPANQLVVPWPSSMNKEEDGLGSLPRFGPPCGVRPYSCFVVDWPHEGLRMN